jgi:thiamine-monophosphate kinase
LPVTERKLLEKIAAWAGPAGAGLVRGIGDDCAIYRPEAGQDLVFTTDFLIEDVHFRRATHKADEIGHKALARGLSDIAAMGAKPRFCLLSLALPAWANARWIENFYKGLLLLAKESGTTLAGGDLARADKLVCDIVVCGSVPKGKALRRDGGRAGDAIFVSGQLGGSALGLATGKGRAAIKHKLPEPRLALGEALRQWGATACIDLSDGLSLDLHRLCVASGVSAELDGILPLFPGASAEQAIHGGEDYELLFTVKKPDLVPDVFEDYLSLTRIGTLRKGNAGRIRIDEYELLPMGYDHFSKP